MSYNGHRQNGGRPSDLDIYNDAAKILEELLEKRNDRNLRVTGRSKRNKSDPLSLRVNIQPSKNAALGNKTGNMRQSKSLDNDLETPDVNFLRNKSYEQENKIVAQGGSESSIDTDYEEIHDADKRNKKSLFRRAKERLRHAFNNQQNKEPEKTTKKGSDTSLSKRYKKKNKQEKKDESLPKKNVETGEDRPVQHKDERSTKPAARKGRHSLPKGGGIGFSSFRSTKRALSVEEHASGQNEKKGHTADSLIEANENDVRRRTDGTSYVPDDGLTGELGPPPPVPSHSLPSSSSPQPPQSTPPPPPKAATTNQESKINSTLQPPQPFGSSVDRKTPSPRPQALPQQSRSPSLSLKSFDAAVDPRLITGAISTSSCNILQPDNTSDESAKKLYSSSQSNVLDSPGEDIAFMDDSPSGVASRAVNVGGDGYVGTVRAVADLPHLIRGLKASGDSTGIVMVSYNSGEAEYGELPFQPPDQDSKKDAIYGKIAEKLMELGDLYSVSDQEVEGAAAPQPPSLSDLEREIILCLRTGGDRYSKQLDESFEEVTQQTTKEAYQRFTSTMQNSIGKDLSWNHLAFLFYTTKGVVSAVGSGSRSASRAKEFTLQYISDTFASWIMDQGGFDSVLSSAESDFDVD